MFFGITIYIISKKYSLTLSVILKTCTLQSINNLRKLNMIFMIIAGAIKMMHCYIFLTSVAFI